MMSHNHWLIRTISRTDSGGWLRRYLQFRYDLSRIYRNSKDINPHYEPVTLFDFRRTNDSIDALTSSSMILQNDPNKDSSTTTDNNNTVKKATKTKTQHSSYDTWRISDDRVIGGYTKSYMKLINTNQHELDEISLSKGQDFLSGISQPPLQKQPNDNNINQTPTSESSNSSSVAAVHGTSEATTTMDRNHPHYKDMDPMKEEKEQSSSLLSIPYLRWYGTIDTDIGLHSNVKRSGFAAIRSPEFSYPQAILFGYEGANLSNMYNAIEIICRSYDHHIYTVNLKIATSLPNDIYQATIYPNMNTTKTTEFQSDDPSSSIYDSLENDQQENNATNNDKNNRSSSLFHQIVIPFNQFTIASMGRQQQQQQQQQQDDRTRKTRSSEKNIVYHRELDDNIKIESIGFIIKDERNGPFMFDLVRIRAVNVYIDTVTGMDVIYDPLETETNDTETTTSTITTEERNARKYLDSFLIKYNTQQSTKHRQQQKFVLNDLIMAQKQQENPSLNTETIKR
jgi:Complex I intermediate-associated protein 30 (CIA30)